MSFDPEHPLADAHIASRLPCSDLDRARRFYSEVLGLEPAEEREGGLLYHGATGSFALFASEGSASGESTQMAFSVDDLDAVMAALRERGVQFEPEAPIEVEGNYPSKGGRGERGVWFRDSEGNLMGIGESI